MKAEAQIETMLALLRRIEFFIVDEAERAKIRDFLEKYDGAAPHQEATT